jgi:hypothetical protein
MGGTYDSIHREPEGKRPLGRPRHIWLYIKMDLREIMWVWTEFIRLRTGTSEW